MVLRWDKQGCRSQCDVEGAFTVVELPLECLDPLLPEQSNLPSRYPEYLVLFRVFYPLLDLQLKCFACSVTVLDSGPDLVALNDLRGTVLCFRIQILQHRFNSPKVGADIFDSGRASLTLSMVLTRN